VVWARFDDDWDDRPEILALTAQGHRAYVASILYVARFTTDGHLPAAALKTRDARAAAELVKRGLWEPTEAGWYAPLWREHVPSRADLEKARNANAERVRRHRKGGP